MLQIRTKHLNGLSGLATQRFEDEMLADLYDFAPHISKIIGEPGIRQVIQLGVRRTDSYGMTSRGPVRFYIQLMFALGSDFDTDPQLPWARSILRNRTIVSQASRADLLYRAMTSYFDAVVGPENSYALQALRRVNESRFEEYQSQRGDFEAKMISTLETVYPEKARYVGEAILRELVRRGVILANAYGIYSELGQSLLGGLMFGFGHGVAEDQLYPWVGATLKNSSDPSARVQRLVKKVRTYVEHMLCNLR